MIKSRIEFVNGKPMIKINGKNYSPLAYTTYFDECGKWSDFIKSGYKMFFVNISFTDLPINNITGFSPFRTGVFESEKPDYAEFDGIVKGIIAECPDAFIFPRINIAMPQKWINENVSETVVTPSGSRRESLFSDLFRADGARFLEMIISHIRESDYAERIAGYQLCGGTTQEWIPHDLFGSYSEKGMEKFRIWAENKYGIMNIEIPSRAELDGTKSEEAKKYYEFCSALTADTICFFAKKLKEIIHGEQITGVFYGYNAFVGDPLWCHHGLSEIIDSPYIDFFSSPCCYDGNRKLGIDWGDMLPADSLKLHGKLYFVECDIRTHLTRRMQDSRPGIYPEDIYPLYDSNGNKTAWCGPENTDLTVSAIRKAFLHQYVKSSGIWWFDMWGGWYHSTELMKELREMRKICEKSNNTDDLPMAETVLFIDEKAYRNVARNSHYIHSVNITRVAMGNTGILFDTYMVEDAPKILHKYRAAIFAAPVPSESGEKALELCRNLGIPYVAADMKKDYFTTDELRQFMIDSGIHCYNCDGCVVYCSNGIIGIHTVSDGEVKISLPGKYRIRSLFEDNADTYITDTITISSKKFYTYMFEIIENI